MTSKKQIRSAGMKYILVLLLLVASHPALARQVTVSAAGPSAQNSPNEYSLEESSVTISENSLTFSGSATPAGLNAVQSVDISPREKILGLLRADEMLRMQVYDSEGRELRNHPLNFFNPNDQSLKVIQFDDGRSITRDNIANFTFFESDGSQAFSISNSTQSESGETISEMESDKFGRTVVLYNPQINYGNQIGSRARVVYDRTNATTLFENQGQIITGVSITENGRFISLISRSSEGDDRVHIFDRFGNELGVLASEEEVAGTVLTEEGEYVTIYSRFRVQVYRIADGERIGSTSLQAEVVTAAYQPDENQLIVLAGDSDGDTRITDGRIYAVDIRARSLGSDDVPGVLTFLGAENIRIERTGSSHFRVTGFNRLLDVQTSF